ncbi:unnamed protein product [Rotaria magnacalcarata]|uniref:G-protein coupled receptors family 1 profile domain-containing protein n=3 Tax=Rotaria magnacalcarata TaxID=392030 RepID=A0A817A502_9BILA|nr:unnamed protein product [Rotaria magnacalcarata]CAF2243309.1 unnamed protein product [Rotaria magnacalcarata]CAF3872667.1 unnamed protein product [Rotaria magnacalcarata]
MLYPSSTSSSSSLTIVHPLSTKPFTVSSAIRWIINEKNSTTSDIETSQTFIQIMWYRFLLVIIIFVTAAGNLLVCLAIARERKLQNTTNYFLMSLAIADCLVAILVMPIGMISEVIGHFPLPHYACVIFATMDVLCCTSSIWHMSTMSMDRYFTIRFPFRYGRNKTRRIMFLKIIVVWTVSAAISSPVFILGIIDKKNVLSDGVCAPNNPPFKIYGSIFAFYIPFIIMITTYALTMRSLRNVLVSKEKYDRERRRKQTFRPLAQVVNQYVEIAEGLRRASLTNDQTILEAVITTATTNNNNNSNNSILNKALNAIKRTASPSDSRISLFSPNNTSVNLHQDNNSKDVINETTFNNELVHHNSQRLTISYSTSNGSKTRSYQQQPFTINTTVHRKDNDIDMSTLHEATEYSTSTSSSNDRSVVINNNNNNNITLMSTVNNEHQVLAIVDRINQAEMSDRRTSTINDVSLLEEEKSTSMLDTYSEIDISECGHMQLALSSFQNVALSHSKEPIFLRIPWKYCFKIIQSILQYYTFYFHYRLNPLSIEYSSNINEKSFKVHQSTSISSIDLILIKLQQSVSTQTTPLSASDYRNVHSNNVDEHCVHNSPKRRKFQFNKPVVSSSSFLTNSFRHLSTTLTRSIDNSSKSTSSPDQRSSAISSSHLIRQPYSSNYSSQKESEQEPFSVIEHRSRTSTSTSSSSLLHRTCGYGSRIFRHYHEPVRRQLGRYQSAHIMPNSCKTRQQHQTISSTTNTNSSDSSVMMLHFPTRLFSTVSHQRVRDTDLAAANERKALRVLMIIFGVFITLWTPFFIGTFISAICEQCRERFSSTVWFSITWLGYSSSMANPFIYTIFSDVFRRAFTNIILCRSTESSASAQISTKLSSPKYNVHRFINQNVSCRRSQNPDMSDAPTPMMLHRPRSVGGSDAKIYINQYASDTIR